MSERWNEGQREDTRPGPYYVTAVKPGGAGYWLMRGPFKTHGAALDAVRDTLDKAGDLDARAHWMGWGTARTGDHGPGRLNPYFEERP